MKGQANLPALAVALLVVTTVTALSVTVADGAFTIADRNAAERATADALADRLVAADSRLTDRRNVLNASRLDARTVADIVPGGVDIRVVIDGETIYERGDPTGPTARRIALRADRQTVTVDPPLTHGETTLPRRSPTATVDIDADAGVETVRANDRVVLHDPDDLGGEYDIALSRYETTTLRFDGDPQPGDVTVTYYPRRTTKALVEVTVDE
ncbi:DUF7263 family protein [Natronomonas amylolytica]|uniref:DUF7263 family protein n=1 Tax=Natronomonas amylolytica TaxID=3108498 RepID=UPI003008778D